MHESFYKDAPAKFTRSWFIMVNTLPEKSHLENEEKLDILNNSGTKNHFFRCFP